MQALDSKRREENAQRDASSPRKVHPGGFARSRLADEDAEHVAALVCRYFFCTWGSVGPLLAPWTVAEGEYELGGVREAIA